MGDTVKARWLLDAGLRPTSMSLLRDVYRSNFTTPLIHLLVYTIYKIFLPVYKLYSKLWNQTKKAWMSEVSYVECERERRTDIDPCTPCTALEKSFSPGAAHFPPHCSHLPSERKGETWMDAWWSFKQTRLLRYSSVRWKSYHNTIEMINIITKQINHRRLTKFLEITHTHTHTSLNNI